MLLVAFGYRELNTRVPDSGTSFTWSSKMFNPWIGWIGGWGLISATVIALSNLAAVAVDFFYILLAQIFQNPDIASWTGNLLVYIPTTLLFTAIAAWLPTVGWPRPRSSNTCWWPSRSWSWSPSPWQHSCTALVSTRQL